MSVSMPVEFGSRLISEIETLFSKHEMLMQQAVQRQLSLLRHEVDAVVARLSTLGQPMWRAQQPGLLQMQSAIRPEDIMSVHGMLNANINRQGRQVEDLIAEHEAMQQRVRTVLFTQGEAAPQFRRQPVPGQPVWQPQAPTGPYGRIVGAFDRDSEAGHMAPTAENLATGWAHGADHGADAGNRDAEAMMPEGDASSCASMGRLYAQLDRVRDTSSEFGFAPAPLQTPPLAVDNAVVRDLRWAGANRGGAQFNACD